MTAAPDLVAVDAPRRRPRRRAIGLGPARALVGRELRVQLRKTRSFVVLALITGMCAGVAAAMWPRETSLFTGGGAASFAITRQIFSVLWWGAVLFLPGVAAASIASERERGTYDPLRMCLLTPGAIVLALFANAIGLYLLMVVAVLPVLSVTLFLVGTGVDEVLVMAATLGATAMAAVAGGLFISAHCRRTVHALLLAYGVLVPLIVFVDRDPHRMSVFGIGPNVLSMPYNDYLVSVVLPVYGLVVVFALFFAAHRLARPEEPKRVPLEKPVDDPAALAARRRTFPYYLIDPLRRREPIGDRQNPIRVRELRWGMATRATAFIRLSYLSVFVCALAGPLFIMYRMDDIRGALQACFMLQAACVALIAPPLVAGSFSREYEQGNIDALRMTLLSPTRIVQGKTLAALAALVPMMAASGVGAVPIAATLFDVPGVGAACVGGVALVAVLGVLALGAALMAAVHVRRTAPALIAAYGLLAAVLVGGDAIGPGIVDFEQTLERMLLDGWGVLGVGLGNAAVVAVFAFFITFLVWQSSSLRHLPPSTRRTFGPLSGVAVFLLLLYLIYLPAFLGDGSRGAGNSYMRYLALLGGVWRWLSPFTAYRELYATTGRLFTVFLMQAGVGVCLIYYAGFRFGRRERDR